MFNVGGDDDSDEGSTEGDGGEDDEDDDDDEELNREAERVMRKLKIRRPFVDEDGILGEKKVKQVSEKAWGKKKTSYYQDEEVDDEEQGGSDEDGEHLIITKLCTARSG